MRSLWFRTSKPTHISPNENLRFELPADHEPIAKKISLTSFQPMHGNWLPARFWKLPKVRYCFATTNRTMTDESKSFRLPWLFAEIRKKRVRLKLPTPRKAFANQSRSYCAAARKRFCNLSELSNWTTATPAKSNMGN